MTLVSSGSSADDLPDTPKESEPAATQAPSLFEVDEAAAIRALERSLIQINALLLAPGQIELGVGLDIRLDRQSSPLLIRSSDDDSLFAGTSDWRTESADIQLDVQIGLPFDMELDLSLPVSSVRSMNSIHSQGFVLDESDDTSTGTGDLNLVLLRTMVRESGYRPDVIAFMAVDGDTAKSSRPAIGSGAIETTIGINATRRQDPLIFTGSLDYTFATNNDDVESGAVTRLTLGTLLAASPDTALQFLIVETYRQASTFEGRELSPGSDTTATLELGLSSVLSRSVSLSGGISTALTSTDARHAFSLSISKRFNLSTLLSKESPL